MKTDSASDFEKDALSKYYNVIRLKDIDELEYKLRKQKYLLELDYNNAKLDRGTVSYLSTISILTIIISYSFADKVYKKKLWLLLTIPLILLLYILFPYGYNYLFKTVYNNNMSLIPYSLSAVLMSIIYYVLFVIIYGKLKNINKKSDIIEADIIEKNDPETTNENNDRDNLKVIEINPDNNEDEKKDDVKYIEINPDDNNK